MSAEVGPYVISAVQVDLGVVFLVARLAKLRAPRAFIRAVAEYRVLPRAAPAFGAAVIASEWFVCAALVSGQFARGGVGRLVGVVGSLRTGDRRQPASRPADPMPLLWRRR